jgi:hypothetical protein
VWLAISSRLYIDVQVEVTSGVRELEVKAEVSLTFEAGSLRARLTGAGDMSGGAGEDARVELSPSSLNGFVPSGSGGTGSRSKV